MKISILSFLIEHGLGEDDSDRILVIQFVAADSEGREAA
jgi:hypothetical protein